MSLLSLFLLFSLSLGGQITDTQETPTPATPGSVEKPFLVDLRARALLGQAQAQFDLGVCYRFGQGVPKNKAEAVKWYRRAAEQGYAKAQYNLGVSYDFGTGVPRDHGQAAKWYRKAAMQGHAKAQFNLGVSYKYGQGVPRDYAEAYAWLSLAAGSGGVKRALSSRKEVVRKLSPQDLEVAKARERKLREEIRLRKVRSEIAQAPRWIPGSK
jgi:TPR repeat protein